ncbi:MAG: TfoX/Sxy family protein [Myxococcales bacterium]|nr:TfoX/Sxy family protein [Myxococcales bacterium]
MSLDAELMDLLLDAVDGLPKVEKKRMFGFEALWADGRIFAAVWKGRISLKHPDLAGLPGARPFAIELGKMLAKPAAWIEVPEAFHDDPHELRRWATRAYELALKQPPPKKKRRRRRA